MSLDIDPNHVFRDFTIDGMPASGKHDPKKVEIREHLTGMWQAVIALVADADPNLTLPNLLVQMTMIGGDENDIEVSFSPEPSSTSLYQVATAQANTGPVTINGKSVLLGNGDPIPAGYLKPATYLLADAGSAYRVMSYGDAEAVQAAAEAALAAAALQADRAENAAGAVSSVAQWSFLDQAALDLFHPEVAPSFIWVDGDYYLRALSEPPHARKVMITLEDESIVWYEIGRRNDLADIDAILPMHPGQFGPLGIGIDRAAFAAMFAALASAGGGRAVIFAGEYHWEDAAPLPIPANVEIAFLEGAVIRQPATGSSGLFSILGGTDNVRLVGSGKLIGPYEGLTPAPALVDSDYINANGCIRILGDVRNPCREIHIDGPQISDWGLFGVFAELAIGGGVYGATKIRRCGRDGIRMYGCNNWRTGYGIEIEDIKPGLAGNPPLLNAYGITATRRATRTTRFASFDNFSNAVWIKGNIASVGSQVTGSSPISVLQKVIPNGSNAVHDLRQSISQSPDQTWTLSIEAKADGYSYLRMSLRQDAGSNGCRANFDLTNGTILVAGAVGSGGAFVDARVEDLGGGIYRCILVGRPATGESVVNARIQILDIPSTSLTDPDAFAGDGSSGILLGEAQIIEGNRDWFARAIRQNPPSDTIFMIGGKVRGVPTWKPLDTHGGRNIFIEDWVLRDCAFGVGIDEGDTVGEENAPPLNIYVDSIDAERGVAELGGAFINAASSSATNLGRNVVIGSKCRGDGFGLTNRGAITIAYIDDFRIDNPSVENSLRPALWIHAGPVSGTVRLNARNASNATAMIVINATEANVLLEGGRLRQTSSLGPIPAFSVNAQSSGYSVSTVSAAWKLEGALT